MLDVSERLASRERWGRERDSRGRGDDVGAVDEGARVVADDGELLHSRGELLDHEVVIGCVSP